MAEGPLDDVLSFHSPLSVDRGGGDIGQAEVGEDVVDGRAVLAEQLAQLREGKEVAAVGEGGDSEGPSGPGGYQPAFCWIGGGERPVGMSACGTGVGPHGQDGGRDQVGGRGDEFHLVCLSQVGGFAGSFLGLVPPSAVDAGPPERGQAGAAGALRAGCPEPQHGVLQQGDRQVGFVQEPCGGTGSPQGGLVKGSATQLAQAPDELASAAERVGASPYPEPVRTGINAGTIAFGRRPLIFQEQENAVYRLAAGRGPCMVGGYGGVREGVP